MPAARNVLRMTNAGRKEIVAEPPAKTTCVAAEAQPPRKSLRVKDRRTAVRR